MSIVKINEIKHFLNICDLYISQIFFCKSRLIANPRSAVVRDSAVSDPVCEKNVKITHDS